MKILLNNIKNELIANIGSGNILSYIQEKSIDVVDYRAVPPLKKADLPYIGIARSSYNEIWVTNKQREAIYGIEIYLITEFKVKEIALIGAGTHIGHIDIVEDILSIIRNKFFTNYLTKPFEINGNSPITIDSDGIFCIASVISGEGRRLFNSVI